MRASLFNLLINTECSPSFLSASRPCPRYACWRAATCTPHKRLCCILRTPAVCRVSSIIYPQSILFTTTHVVVYPPSAVRFFYHRRPCPLRVALALAPRSYISPHLIDGMDITFASRLVSPPRHSRSAISAFNDCAAFWTYEYRPTNIPFPASLRLLSILPIHCCRHSTYPDLGA